VIFITHSDSSNYSQHHGWRVTRINWVLLMKTENVINQSRSITMIKKQHIPHSFVLFLLKEKYQLSDATVDKILKQCQIDPLDLMSESSQWYVLGDKQLSPGVYRLREDRVTCLDVEVNAKDTVRVSSESYPTGEIFGLDIYEVTHINTNQPVYITVGELYK
jgi:hypothetical protein